MTDTQLEPTPDAPRRRGLTFWLWIVFGGVVALLVSPFVIGTLLPASYSGSASAVIALPRDELWTALQDVERFPLSAGLARGVQRLADRDGLPAWIEEQQNRAWTVTTLELEPPARLVRRVEDASSPLACTWEIRIVPDGARSRIEVEQRCAMTGGRLAAPHLRFVMHFMHGASMGPRAYLRRLADELDEPAVVD